MLAGDLAAAGRGGVLAAVRADRSLAADVSTVDSADTATGQILTVYAVAEQAAGHAGHYGLAPSADATVPAT